MSDRRTIVDAEGTEWTVTTRRPHVAPGNVATLSEAPRLEFRNSLWRVSLPIGEYPQNWSSLDDRHLLRLLARARLRSDRGTVRAVFHFADGSEKEHEVPNPAPPEYDVTEPMHVDATWEAGAVPRSARFITHWFSRRPASSASELAHYDETHAEEH